MKGTTDMDGNGVVIRCRHIHVAFGQQQVLRGVNLDVHDGDFLPLIGPNGAGKTTLLRTIVGLVKPNRGRVHTPFRQHPPAYVPQQKSIDPLYPLSTRQIVRMGLYPELGWWRRPSDQQKSRVSRWLDQLKLSEHADKTFSELSGGMRQKALIARALAPGAKVLVLDEPTSELDEESERDVLHHLTMLNREEGKTILLAHHGRDKVAKLATRLCLVDHGKVSIETPMSSAAETV